MTKQSRNLLFCRIISLLILFMLIRYRAISVLIRDPGISVFTTIIVLLFYALNLATLIGLFFAKSWGFITSYFSIPISTFLFAVSYAPFLSDWLPMSARVYVVPVLNALLLVGIVSLQMQQRRFQQTGD